MKSIHVHQMRFDSAIKKLFDTCETPNVTDSHLFRRLADVIFAQRAYEQASREGVFEGKGISVVPMLSQLSPLGKSRFERLYVSPQWRELVQYASLAEPGGEGLLAKDHEYMWELANVRKVVAQCHMAGSNICLANVTSN